MDQDNFVVNRESLFVKIIMGCDCGPDRICPVPTRFRAAHWPPAVTGVNYLCYIYVNDQPQRIAIEYNSATYLGTLFSCISKNCLKNFLVISDMTNYLSKKD